MDDGKAGPVSAIDFRILVAAFRNMAGNDLVPTQEARQRVVGLVRELTGNEDVDEDLILRIIDQAETT